MNLQRILTLRKTRFPGALILSLAVASISMAAPGAGPGPGPDPAGSSTDLQGSLDLGDLGYMWTYEISVEGTEHLWFQWATEEPGAVAGRYVVTDEQGVPVFVGETGASAAPGAYRLFDLHLTTLLPEPAYKVRIQPLDEEGNPVGDPSGYVLVERVCPGPVTQFTDAGLGLPIDEQLEAIRAARNVPALGGAIITDTGVDVIGVTGKRKQGLGGSDVDATELDRWHLGSDTKAMTGTLIGLYVQAGWLDWDETIGDVFPEWLSTMDSEFRDVTIEQLMAHRSGIVQLSEHEASALWGPGSVMDQRREFTRRIVHRTSLGVPEVTFSYQNANMIIAGAMLEKISGVSWEYMMQTFLFDPLGMSSAGFGAPGTGTQVDEPWGHSDSTGMRVPNRGDNAPSLGPAGTVHASLRDWGKFLRLHLTGAWGSLYLQPATLARLHTEHASNPLWPQRYGWGWGIFDEFGGQALGHDGSNGSWYCSVAVYPEQGFALLAVSNIGGDDNGNGDVAAWDVIELLKARATEEAGGRVERECDDPAIRQVAAVSTSPRSTLPSSDPGMAEFYSSAQAIEAELGDTQAQVGECSESLSETGARLEVCLAGGEPTDPLVGDVNGDGQVDVRDILAVNALIFAR